MPAEDIFTQSFHPVFPKSLSPFFLPSLPFPTVRRIIPSPPASTLPLSSPQTLSLLSFIENSASHTLLSGGTSDIFCQFQRSLNFSLHTPKAMNYIISASLRKRSLNNLSSRKHISEGEISWKFYLTRIKKKKDLSFYLCAHLQRAGAPWNWSCRWLCAAGSGYCWEANLGPLQEQLVLSNNWAISLADNKNFLPSRICIP